MAFESNLTVDLHSHLFMKQGIPWIFNGDFQGPIQAKHWKDRFSSKVNPETLWDSNLGITVIALYTHGAFGLNLRKRIRDQIRCAEDFVNQDSRFIIARNPIEAEKALNQGKRVLILSLEGASGVIESDEDIKEFIDEKGIRIVTLMHFIDDLFGGAALMKGALGLMNPLGFLKSLLKNSKRNGIRVTPTGLKDPGKSLVEKLTQKNVWIDLAHASDQTQDDLYPFFQSEGLPLLYTHTVSRSFYQGERAVSSIQLQRLKETAGVVGLMPCQQMTSHKECPHGFASFKKHFDDFKEYLPETQIFLGTDFNGAIGHFGPTPSSNTGLDEKGLLHAGLLPEVWKGLQIHQSFHSENLSLGVEKFLETWERVFQGKK